MKGFGFLGSLFFLVLLVLLGGWGAKEERTHSGKHCYGKTPLQTFIESALLALDKQLSNKYPTPQSEQVAV